MAITYKRASMSVCKDVLLELETKSLPEQRRGARNEAPEQADSLIVMSSTESAILEIRSYGFWRTVQAKTLSI